MPRKSQNKMSTGSVVDSPSPAMDARHEARERKYRCEEALRTLSRADEIRKDKPLMRDVKQEAKRLSSTVLGKPSRNK